MKCVEVGRSIVVSVLQVLGPVLSTDASVSGISANKLHTAITIKAIINICY